ncbi:MAG: DUF1579 domain-containing protein [Thermoanaerobaculales bacterium]
MRGKVAFVGCVALVLLVAGALVVGADDKAAAKKMTPEQQAMMEAWMKAATPGENHKLLEPMVGTFNAKVTMWGMPGQPPDVSSGTSENSWVLGGRFVQQVFDGQEMGQPFHGIGYTGYDNYKKKYTGTWMDSMGTMTLLMTGTADADGKVFKFEGTMDDVVSGKASTIRTVTRVIDRNQHVFEMYGPDPSGKESKVLEIVYTRK